MENKMVKKMALAGILIAVGVVCSPFSIPVGLSKCFPVQHMVNVFAGVLLGPWYGVGMAFVTSAIRVLMGTGSLLAFPGSMCGALLCGILYRCTRKEWAAYIGEVVGTSVIGGMLAYPVATMLMNQTAALFGYVMPFFISTIGGTIIAGIVLFFLKRTKAFGEIQK